MMRIISWLGLVVFLVLAGVLSYGWRVSLQRANDTMCFACQRPVHSHVKTVATVGGRRKVFCCPACALSARRQGDKNVQITELVDYLTGAKLRPSEAYLVQNSDVNPCLRHQPLVDQSKNPMSVEFDRCAPSALAFRDSTEASDFQSKHGGRVVRFNELTLTAAQ